MLPRRLVSTVLTICTLALLPQFNAHAQLRIVSYNTLDNPANTTDDANFNLIFDAISNKSVNGIAKRVDVIALQEQTVTTVTRIANLLNTLHGVSSYVADLTQPSGPDITGIVYDSSTVTLLADTNVFTSTRLTYRAQFRPVGYTSSDADFYVYSSHFKAGSSMSDEMTRTTEGLQISTNADNLGPGINAIFAGDFNFGDDTEGGYLHLLGPGDGQGHDPKQVTTWPSAIFAGDMTQSTRTSGGGGAGGGMDDRFDLQIATGELLDGEGITYIGPTSTGLFSLAHSYQAFGNDGTSWNQAITSPATGRSQPANVLQALHDFSDHLPVVADYQLPAVMQATLPSPPPASVQMNDVVPLDVLVENIASVVHANGADELDYTLSVSGDLTLSGGPINDMTLALSGGNTHQVTLDTSSTGSKSGTISVSTASLAAENTLIEIPVSFDVTGSFLEADFNQDTFVNAADLAQWEGDFGVNGDSDADDDGDSTGLDFLVWQQQNGMSTLSASQAVPEPATLCLGLSLILLWGPAGRSNRSSGS